MIEFQYWLSEIVGYCDLIASGSPLREAWINQDFSNTSVIDFDELYEQIFGDLDSDAFDAALMIHLPANADARELLSKFLGAIRSIDQLREHRADLKNPHNLLQSAEWREVENMARRAKRGLEDLIKS